MIKVDDKDLPSEKVRKSLLTPAHTSPHHPPHRNSHPDSDHQAIWENAHGLARYAAIAQENGLVPIVEPEVTLGEGDYSIERTAYISERVNSIVMNWLNRYDVCLDAILLKPNMILPGLDAPVAPKEEVAKWTVRVRACRRAAGRTHVVAGKLGGRWHVAYMYGWFFASPPIPDR